MLVDGVAEFDDALVDAPGVGDHHQQQPGRGQGDHLEVPHARRGQRRVLHDRDLPGQLGQQPHRAAQHVVEVDAGLEEGQDRASLRGRQRLDVVEPVDELAVALLGGHPARAGVRLGDVALGLQDGHVVAHGGAGDAEVVPLDERLRTDRLLGGHEVGDDGAQHLEATVVGATQLFTYPSQRVSAHFTGINRGNTARAVVRVADGQVVYDQSVSSNSDKWSAPPLSGVIWSGRWCGMSVSSRVLRAGFASTRGVLVGAVASAGVGGSAPLFGGPGIIEVMLFAPAGEVHRRVAVAVRGMSRSNPVHGTFGLGLGFALA